MNKERVITFILMAFLGMLGGLFYFQMFQVLETDLNIIISISLFIGGLMLLNLIIDRIIPLSKYRASHPIRLAGYLVFVLFLILTVTLADGN